MPHGVGERNEYVDKTVKKYKIRYIVAIIEVNCDKKSIYFLPTKFITDPDVTYCAMTERSINKYQCNEKSIFITYITLICDKNRDVITNGPDSL